MRSYHFISKMVADRTDQSAFLANTFQHLPDHHCHRTFPLCAGHANHFQLISRTSKPDPADPGKSFPCIFYQNDGNIFRKLQHPSPRYQFFYQNAGCPKVAGFFYIIMSICPASLNADKQTVFFCLLGITGNPPDFHLFF